ncbi:kinase-like protein [Rhizophagus irregularis]|uniref:Kinase-like protein n=1 Tax=Rhizophagus irregularis TaxID=588596 RepID=A0A2N0PFB8_9GLOM|nr:kinase-like protein [Rhizophagus irregularis]
MAPEIFQRQKYNKASDIYSFGMIMWELMTGRRPFWDRNHDTELIIDICDGLRPPIVTNAPKGYIELMEECWHSDPSKRPTADDIYKRINKLADKEWENIENKNETEIMIESSDIGPVPKNNPGAIYRSRPLSAMINSAMSLRSSRSQSISLEKLKRRFEDYLIEDNNDYGRSIKREKLYENEDYLTKEIDLDIDVNFDDNGYITNEIDFDIDTLK